jgi:hypothetical protein
MLAVKTVLQWIQIHRCLATGVRIHKRLPNGPL